MIFFRKKCKYHKKMSMLNNINENKYPRIKYSCAKHQMEKAWKGILPRGLDFRKFSHSVPACLA